MPTLKELAGQELAQRYSRANSTRVTPRIQTMMPAEPSLRSSLSEFMRDVVDATGLSGGYRQGLLNAAGGMETAMDFAPIVGDALALEDAGRSYRQGDMVGTGINLLGAVPIVGDAASKMAKTAMALGGQPQKTQKAYKLFRTKPNDDTLYPLFVNANKGVPTGQWIPAEVGEMTNTGQVKSSIGSLAYRPGWHAGDAPSATHIGGKSSKGLKKPDYRPASQAWAEVELPDDVDWQAIANERASRNKAGEIIPRTAQISDQIPEGGYYRYKTNPNMQGNWLIGGSMRVNKPISQAEAMSIGQKLGAPDLPTLPEVISQKGLTLEDMSSAAKKELQQFYPDVYNLMIGKK